ncbi:hypothetical protein SAMN05216302_102147 [Nitrosomonas aestuarii]|uniref:Helix-turn-helix domain-containing protein n=1 Tax=Nitrosomonas aestuarii TaxID=52441 RepID=A0A1I4DH64_9PROT|nr:hypothetical protein [Nitrosomonas aestuarii]SFK92822.1 hypothetical protein SAMN05216302_102147 [Nitrosomonas aestuarii]
MLTAVQIAEILKITDNAAHKIARREEWESHKSVINNASTRVYHVTPEAIRDYKIARRNRARVSPVEKRKIKAEQQAQCINNIFSVMDGARTTRMKKIKAA